MLKEEPVDLQQNPIQESEERIHDELAKNGHLGSTSSQIAIVQTQRVQPTANLEIALQRARAGTGHQKSNRTLTMYSPISQFVQFGPGIYLFFTFLKKSMILFLVLAVISIIPMLYNCIAGTVYSSDAVGINVKFARATVGAHSSSADNHYEAKLVNLVIVVLSLGCCFSFWLYWKHILTEGADKLERSERLGNYNAVVVEEIPQDVQIEELQGYLRQFGEIKQVVEVINRGESVVIRKEITRLKMQSEQHSKNIELSPQNANKFIKLLSAKRKKIEQLTVELKREMERVESAGRKVIRYFVVFDNHEAMLDVVARFQSYAGCCCKKEYPEELLLRGSKIAIRKCEAQPQEIYWENQHVGAKQLIVPNVVLFLLTNVVSISTIILSSLLDGSVQPVYYDSILASNSFSLSQVQALNDSKAMGSWCLSHGQSTASSSACSFYLDLHASRMNIYLWIAVLILISRMCIKQVVLFMRPYLRFKDKAEESAGVMTHLFVNYTMISVLVALSVQTNLFGSAVGDIVSALVQIPALKQNIQNLQYYFDYTSLWYCDYGFQLMVNLIVAAVFPHVLAPLLEWAAARWRRYGVQKLQLQVEMERQLSAGVFEVQDHYATCYMLMFVGLIFAGGNPIMMVIVLLGLCLRYLSAKYLLLYCQEVGVASSCFLISKTPSFLVLFYAGYMLNSIWALGVEFIFQSESQLFTTLGIDKNSNGHSPWEAVLVFLRRLGSSWPIGMVFFLGVLAMGLRHRFQTVAVRLIRRLTAHLDKDKESSVVVHNEGEGEWGGHAADYGEKV